MTHPTTTRTFGLSKSKITMFEQCPKRLWLATHRKDLAEYDEGAEARFAAGHEIGAIACALISDGIMVEAEPDLRAAVDRTRELLALQQPRTIFEATLEHDGVLVRIDILEPNKGGGWNLIEVKSSGSAKDYHHNDLATQLWVARQCGLTIRSASIRHVDTRFVLEEPGNYRGLFRDTELLHAVGDIVAKREEQVGGARAALGGPQPEKECGDHCSSPFVCEFTAYCRSSLPPGPEWTVDVLNNGGGKKWRARGIEDLFDIDSSMLGSPTHQRIYHATVNNEPYHDPDGARGAMNDWDFPRAWLDFETIAFAAPRWVGTRPYQQVPFQYSVHVEQRDGTIDHREFLSLNGADPRRACAEALVSDVPATGAVIAYNASFERSQVKALADVFPDLAPALLSVADRLVDLLPVTRAHYYHRDQRGSWSIKAVLPTVSDLDYATLEIKDGGSAQQAYLSAMCADCSDEEREMLAEELKAYCGRDTWAMIVLARRLTGSAQS
ncbi:hypothetical protein GCM10022280_18600 [Sphingomonas swuensis]|uniref:DUF2779 domain-containing protein n=1 Tax=Sphingomonas swuensis TaxID=977800 RepID=A0ABP7T099_9SPHN